MPLAPLDEKAMTENSRGFFNARQKSEMNSISAFFVSHNGDGNNNQGYHAPEERCAMRTLR